MALLKNLRRIGNVLNNIPQSNNIKKAIRILQTANSARLNINTIMLLTPAAKPPVRFNAINLPATLFRNMKKTAAGSAYVKNFSRLGEFFNKSQTIKKRRLRSEER